MNDFVSWFNQEANRLGLSYADIARTGRISKSMVSRVVSGQSQPGLEFLLAVCRAFRLPADVVLSRAGLLPSMPEAVSEERELVTIIREQPEVVRRTLLSMLRGLVHQRPAPGVDDDPLLAEIAASYQQLNPGGRLELHRASKLIERGAHVAVEEELVA